MSEDKINVVETDKFFAAATNKKVKDHDKVIQVNIDNLSSYRELELIKFLKENKYKFERVDVF